MSHCSFVLLVLSFFTIALICCHHSVLFIVLTVRENKRHNLRKKLYLLPVPAKKIKIIILYFALRHYKVDFRFHRAYSLNVSLSKKNIGYVFE